MLFKSIIYSILIIFVIIVTLILSNFVLYNQHEHPPLPNANTNTNTQIPDSGNYNNTHQHQPHQHQPHSQQQNQQQNQTQSIQIQTEIPREREQQQQQQQENQKKKNNCNTYFDLVCDNWKGRYNKLFKQIMINNEITINQIKWRIKSPTGDLIKVRNHNPETNKFYKSCIQISNNPSYLNIDKSVDFLIEKIENVKSKSDLPFIFGYLHSYGISVPIKVHEREVPYILDKSRKRVYEFQSSGFFYHDHPPPSGSNRDPNVDPIETNVNRNQKEKEKENRLISWKKINEQLIGSSYEINTLNDFRRILKPLRSYKSIFVNSNFDLILFLKTIHILDDDFDEDLLFYTFSSNFLINLDFIIQSFLIEDWKNYLIVNTYLSIEKRIPPTLNHQPSIEQQHYTQQQTDEIEKNCLRLTRIFFPVSFCEDFLDQIEINKNLKSIINQSFSLVKEMVKSNQIYCSDDQTKKLLLERFDTIDFSVGECLVVDMNNRISYNNKNLSQIERSHPMNDSDYIQNIFTLLHDKDYNILRRSFLDDYDNTTTLPFSVELQDSLSIPNAWYDPLNHRLIVPPGILRGNIVADIIPVIFIVIHELTHSTEDLLQSTDCGCRESDCFINHFDKYYGLRTYKENRADAYGWKVSYLVNNKIKLLSNQKYIHSISSLWCDNSESYDEHPKGRDRTLNMLYVKAVKEKFNEIYNCSDEFLQLRNKTCI
jgi:hypothetical protein